MADILNDLDPNQLKIIGNVALPSVLEGPTYAHQAEQVQKILFVYIEIPKKAIA